MKCVFFRIIEDCASPDVAVIEDELNLEELMRQKALLQARLGAYASESEEEPNAVKTVPENKDTKRKLESDVITLDDSSDEVVFKTDKKLRSKSPSKKPEKKVRRDKERESSSKPPKERDERKPHSQEDGKRKREYDNRQKEDLRQEINRGKDRERDRRPER